MQAIALGGSLLVDKEITGQGIIAASLPPDNAY